MSEAEPLRLARRVAALAGCSRREAEMYIEGGWVRVNGTVVDIPGAKVRHETVTLDPQATLEPVADVTLLLHKPPGFGTEEGAGRPVQQLLVPANHLPTDRAGIRTVRRHFDQTCLTPLEPAASGLVVFSQDWRIQRKLQEDAALIEHEVSVDVQGEVGPEALHQLNRSPIIDGRAMLPAKVSISRQTDTLTGLRFAGKGHWPGRIAQMCDTAGLRILTMKRIRVGRIALAGLEPGQWRYLLPYERF
ncbi:MAG: RNA pseudouridine synthase [Pseudomonadota bacterium]